MSIPSNWSSNPDYQKILIAVFKYYTTSEKTIYAATHPLTATYNGNLVGFMPRLVGDTSFSVGLVDSDKGSRTTSAVGRLNFINSDGGLDHWLDYGLDGRNIKLYLLPYDSTNIDVDGIKVFDGSIDFLEVPDNNTIALTFKDQLLTLDFPITSLTYTVGETITYNLGAGNVTITITDNLKDKNKPICYGTVLNIEPVLIASATKTYQVDSKAIEEVTAVYDRGVLLTPITGYKVDLSKGIIQLVNNNSGTITCDVKGRKLLTGSFSDYASDIIMDIVKEKGISIGKLVYISTIYAKVGIYITEVQNTLDVLDRIVASFDGFYGFDTAGYLLIGNLTIPNTVVASFINAANFGKYGDVFEQGIGVKHILASDAFDPFYANLDTLSESALLTRFHGPIYITSSDIIGDIQLTPSNNVVFSSKVQYQKNNTVQTDIAGIVTDARKEFLSKEFREIILIDNTIKTKHTRAVEKTVENTLLINVETAKQLANRGLKKNKTPVYELKIKVSTKVIGNYTIGTVVHVDDYRYGLNGVLGCLRDYSINYLEGTADITVLLAKVPNQEGTFTYNMPATITIPQHTNIFIGDGLDGNDYAYHNVGRKYIELDKTMNPYDLITLRIAKSTTALITDPLITIRNVVSGTNIVTANGGPDINISAAHNLGILIDFESYKVGLYSNGVLVTSFDLPANYISLKLKVFNDTTGNYNVFPQAVLPSVPNVTSWNTLEVKREFVYI